MKNEKRLIDANAALDQVCCNCCCDPDECRMKDDFCSDYTNIAQLPTVDAVPVVRCKDCVSGHKAPYGILIRCSVFGCSGLTEDDFCSQGERRSNA